MASTLRVGLLVAAALVVAGLLGEAALRVAGFRFELTPERVEFGWPDVRNYRYLYDADPDLFWVPKDYASQLAALATLHDPLVFLGDSCTQFGGYVEAFAARAEAQAGRAPRVFKLGVAGWSSAQGRVQLERDVAPLAPRLVSFYYGWNDHWIGFGVEDSELAEVRVVDDALLGQLRLVQLVTKARLAWKLRAGRRPLRVPPEAFGANLAAMVRTARAAGATPLLLTAPTAHERGAEPAYLAERFLPDLSELVPLHERYADVVREVAAAEAAPLCDLQRSIAALPHARVRDELFQADGIHLRPAGDAVLAELLLQCFERDPALRDALAAASAPDAATP